MLRPFLQYVHRSNFRNASLMTVCIKKSTRIIAVSLCKYKTILFGAKSFLTFLAGVTVPGEGQ